MSEQTAFTHSKPPTREKIVHAAHGWKVLPLLTLGFVASIALIIAGGLVLNSNEETHNSTFFLGLCALLLGIVCVICTSISYLGFFTLEPNEARVLILFGEYKGTVQETGFYWGNPFYTRSPKSSIQVNAKTTKDGHEENNTESDKAVKSLISLRARTLNSSKLKVNDKNGNPIEIAAVIVWRVIDTAKAVFDVDDYEQYVRTQSETALRYVASLYTYDHNADSDDAGIDQITLRSNISEISTTLKNELEERLSAAGIQIDDARLSHLAYAPEIAQVMLRRQQAEAIIAARTKIVQGAVSMVDMAIKELEADNVVELDSERKAAMVSNLMVVLCSENDAQPVLNTGTLYN